MPEGLSCWEFGVTADKKGKADDDYEKRSKDPLGIDPLQATFIYATLQRWGNKDEWITAKKAENFWKDVRAYDADDLVQWLEIAPNVHIWISNYLGKHPEDAIDLLNYWLEWQSKIKFALPPKFFLAGRAGVEVSLLDWLKNSNQPISIKADTREEALLVFIATIKGLLKNECDAVSDQTVIVFDHRSWGRLTHSNLPLILVPMFDEKRKISQALSHKHRILIPLGRSENYSPNTIHIPRISRVETVKILKDMEFTYEKAEEYATLARRSLFSFIREIAYIPEVIQPDWSQPEHVHSLLPFFLASGWDETKDGDKHIISNLAMKTYDEVSKVLALWVNEDDPPIRRIGKDWYFISKKDAWFYF